MDEQAEILEETTDMLKSTTKELQECKQALKKKYCDGKCGAKIQAKLQGELAVVNHKLNTTKKEAEKYKNDLINKQNMIIQANQEVLNHKQIIEDLQAQLLVREKSLAMAQDKIQELSEESDSFDDQLKQGKSSVEETVKATGSKKHSLSAVIAKLSYSETSLDNTKSKLMHKERELAMMSKLYTDVKGEYDQQVFELTDLREKLHQAKTELIDKDKIIEILRKERETIQSDQSRLQRKWFNTKLITVFHFILKSSKILL